MGKDSSRISRRKLEARITAEDLKATFNVISEALVACDEKGRFIYWNQAAEEISGIGPLDASPDHWSELYGAFHPDTMVPMPTEDLPLVRAIKGEETRDVEIFLRHEKQPNGIYISVDGHTLRKKDGSIRGGLIVVRDITEKWISNREKRDRQKREGAFLEAQPDLMFRVSRTGQFLDYRAPDPELLAVDPEWIIGSNVREVLPTDVAEAFLWSIKEVIDHRRPQSLEYDLMVGKGKRSFEARLMLSGPEEILGIVRDVTDDNRKERSLQASQKKVVQAAKMAAVAELSEGLANALEVPLTRLRKSLLSMLDRIGTESMSSLTDQLTRISYIVEQLRWFARPRDLPAEPTDVRKVLEESFENLRKGDDDASVRFTRALPKNLPRVMADPTLLLQVFHILFSNARDAIECLAGPDDGLIRVSAELREDWVEVTVADSGIDIPPEMEHRLFEPFFSTKDEGAAPGLGLAIAHGIMRDLDGSIEFRRGEKGEKQFVVRLRIDG